jgi:NAD(P)H-nitrite reductase large subunit
MKILIIGAGPAGVSAAETVRLHDPACEISMFSAEDSLPYSPPALADHFLHGSDSHLWRDEDWPEQYGILYNQGAEVVSIKPDAHSIQLKDGSRFAYDRLVIATGGRLYAPVPGSDMPGVHNFKSLSAAEAIVARVRSGEAKKAVIVGAGFIGMEIALLLRELGVDVIQVEMLDQVMSNMLDPDTAGIARDRMLAHGIDLRLNTKAEAFTGDGTARAVKLASGEVLQADILIAATGLRPNLGLLAGSGIEHGTGIRVSSQLRTSAPDIYAAGDAVEVQDCLTGETYVHAILPNAIEQGRVVGLNLAGYPTDYEGAERMNSLKHLGLPIIAAGLKDGDEVLQDKKNGCLRTLYLRQDRLVGYQLAGDIRSAGILRSLMLQGAALGSLKQHLLEANFGEGMIAWHAMQAFA